MFFCRCAVVTKDQTMSADPTDIDSKNQKQDSVSYIPYIFNVISDMFYLLTGSIICVN